MKIKILQLNTMGGKGVEQIGGIVNFVKKNKFDICNFQEVGKGKTMGHNGGKNNYLHYKKAFSAYDSVLAKRGTIKGEPGSYFGNAIFYKLKFKLISASLLWLKKFHAVIPGEVGWRKAPINILSLRLSVKDKEFYLINTHLAKSTGPKEFKYQRDQNKKLVKYVRSLESPFILTGDFNITKNAPTVKELGKLARNLTVENRVLNTLNPKTHSAKHLFPKGLAVDYIFVSKHFKVKKFRVIKSPSLSDHYGLEASLEL